MIDFAVFALGRSGSTWTTAWLSKYAHVLHDPILHMSLNDVNSWAATKSGPTGICCTASWMFGYDEDLSEAGVPIVCLDRALEAVNESYERLGFPPLPIPVAHRFYSIDAKRVPYWKLLSSPIVASEMLGKLLPEVEFDLDHYNEFRGMHIEPTEDVLDQLKEMLA